jgi:plasmid stabilization system protein ParE
MRIRWTIPAVDDLEGINRYLEREHPEFAEALCGRFIGVFSL